MFLECFDQADDVGVLGRNAISDGRSDVVDFLQHLYEGIVFVFAGSDLA